MYIYLYVFTEKTLVPFKDVTNQSEQKKLKLKDTSHIEETEYILPNEANIQHIEGEQVMQHLEKEENSVETSNKSMLHVFSIKKIQL